MLIQQRTAQGTDHLVDERQSYEQTQKFNTLIVKAVGTMGGGRVGEAPVFDVLGSKSSFSKFLLRGMFFYQQLFAFGYGIRRGSCMYSDLG